MKNFFCAKYAIFYNYIHYEIAKTIKTYVNL